ncbi:MAG: hypothetical protein KC561_04845 [Myxococcales bacterium]|nr:hypothetical protein [Myxococcales bacterium]
MNTTTEPNTILVCSLTEKPLRPLGKEEVEHLNQRIRQGVVRHRTGEIAAVVVDGGLATPDAAVIYPIRGDLPCLLPEDALDGRPA